MKPLAALLLAAALASPAVAGDPACKGTISGAARGTFTCKLGVFEKDGSHYLVIEPLGPVEGIPGYWPGSFELPGKPEARRYTLDQLVAGRASVGVEGGALYSATKTSSQRGEVTLEFRSVKPDRGAPGSFRVRGSYRARLLPVGAGKSGEVLLDVTF
ncbi:MAG: hypothetical protein HZB56_21100 [Deltaproteobacteria bacterium]|nr:hypothetical protein [Deltaproteobacteria bacterium]